MIKLTWFKRVTRQRNHMSLRLWWQISPRHQRLKRKIPAAQEIFSTGNWVINHKGHLSSCLKTWMRVVRWRKDSSFKIRRTRLIASELKSFRADQSTQSWCLWATCLYKNQQTRSSLMDLLRVLMAQSCRSQIRQVLDWIDMSQPRDISLAECQRTTKRQSSLESTTRQNQTIAISQDSTSPRCSKERMSQQARRTDHLAEEYLAWMQMKSRRRPTINCLDCQMLQTEMTLTSTT